ncbi:MAG: hypothetical protein E6I84_07710 [Chloroflexi bacterium]|nr:MAG: hypothetical protein E6I84_07710 [Chloroflexota bacterium]
MKRILAVACSIFASAIVAIPANASGPTRTPTPNPPIQLTNVCAFPVALTFPVSNTYVITFTDSLGNVTRQIFAGHLVVTFTNDVTLKSLTTNFSGPAFITAHPDGSTTLVFVGPQGGPLSNTLLAGAGRTVFQIAADGTIAQTQVGHFYDVCAALTR